MSVPDVARRFGSLDPSRAWFNTAHQGPLPDPAVAETRRAGQLKADPHLIADGDFVAVPERLRHRLAALVAGRPDEIVLGNSTSYGLHVIANGLPWRPGDEVLTVAGDYPATVLPWQLPAERGVRVRALHPDGDRLTPDQLASEITPRTRLLAVTWVDSFTGRALDLAALGRTCRAHGVRLVVNASQALGARPLDAPAAAIDAVVSCGYKWLCGPYGTGFAWLAPDLRDELRPQQAYWLAMQSGHGLDHMRETTVRDDLGVRAFDVFCPAAFATTLPWIASLELFLAAGLDPIADHDQQLVDRLVTGIDPDVYELVSPASGPARSTLVVLSRRDGSAAQRHRMLTDAGIDVAYREGNLRLSVHLFNTATQIDRALDRLHEREPTGDALRHDRQR
jgi:cysteine desulfurase/selenocysteine lyase